MWVDSITLKHTIDGVTKEYRVVLNGAWTYIYDEDRKLIYKREADQGPWFDETHSIIINAKWAIEKAVAAAIL